MFCTNCGKQNAANAKFCNTCGTAITGNSAHQPAARKSPKPINKALFAIPAVVLAVVVAGVLLLPGFGNSEPTPIAPTAPTAPTAANPSDSPDNAPPVSPANPSDTPDNAPPASPSLQGRVAQAQIDTAIVAVEDFLRQLHTSQFYVWDFNRNGIPEIFANEGWTTSAIYMFNGQEYERVTDFDLSDDTWDWFFLADEKENIVFMDMQVLGEWLDSGFIVEFSYFDIITRQTARPLASVSVHSIEEVEDVISFQITTLNHLTGEEDTVRQEITEEAAIRIFEEFGESFEDIFSVPGMGILGAERRVLLSLLFNPNPVDGTMTVADTTLFLGYSMQELQQELRELQRAAAPAAVPVLPPPAPAAEPAPAVVAEPPPAAAAPEPPLAAVAPATEATLYGIYVFDSNNPQFSGGFNHGDVVMWGDSVYRDSSISIAFLSGNRFTITDYRMRAYPNLQSPSGLPGDIRARNVETPRLPFWNDRTVFNSEMADPGLWFSTINDVESTLARRTSDGTFSVSDGQIEFVHSGGSIEVLQFEQTLNAITISGIRFYRQ
ncbi:MAG: zinc-ribbon domain-containing protein [Defluviitaleaceae bacterium]|nr:zinc-ribbon domain-containing protein [Defluviitaleaceae bacterium]